MTDKRTDKQQVTARLAALITDAKCRLDAGQLSVRDRQAVLRIMAYITDLARHDHLLAAWHLCEALTRLLADIEAATNHPAGAAQVAAFPGPPGRRALVAALHPLHPTRDGSSDTDVRSLEIHR